MYSGPEIKHQKLFLRKVSSYIPTHVDGLRQSCFALPAALLGTSSRENVMLSPIPEPLRGARLQAVDLRGTRV
jgi:hypothetical protein